MIEKNNTYIRNLSILFWCIIGIRVVSIFLLPLTDTTEARYANTALMMSNLNDWITPFFKYHEPFLGKPPLAFWFEALSYKIFPVADFVPRLPSLFITLATVWLIYKLVLTLHNKLTAVLASLIYVSSSVVFVLSGVVTTDPFLVFGTTLSLVSFLLVANGHNTSYWKYLFFVGAGLGILTKGPLALVIIGGIITIWILLSYKKRIISLKLFPWIKGLLLMCLIFVPWYTAQEIKNPGFLYYFIVGENLGRFLDTGWHGDKYGYVHKEPHGMIWIYWLLASFPWSFVALTFMIKHIKTVSKYKIITFLKNDILSFYLVWALFIMLFFSLGANTLWYYILPSIGGFSILLALFFTKENAKIFLNRIKIIQYTSLFLPIISLIAISFIIIRPDSIKTEKYIIQTYKNKVKKGEAIYFIGRTSFSSAYYMNTGKNLKDLTPKEYRKITRNSKNRYFVVINKNEINKIDSKNLKKIYMSKKYILLESLSFKSPKLMDDKCYKRHYSNNKKSM